MKPTNILFTLSLVLATSLASHAQVGIGTSSPNASAVLDVSSTTKGFLPPRMTTTERNAILSPAVGLVIFNTTTNCLNFYGGLWIETCGTSRYSTYSVFCGSGETTVIDVTNPTTGKIWMDRNLGANRAATSSTDAESYGSLFQWGRRADGHQCAYRYSGDGVTTSPNTVLNATDSTDTPNHGNFIITNVSNDWRSPQNNNLWQGVNGINNPCPSGYRIPTNAEWEAERLSWVQPPVSSTNNAAGAFASPLKLLMAGRRSGGPGSLGGVGTHGNYWSSTVSGTDSRRLYFDSSIADMGGSGRANGDSIRCLKD